MDFQGLSNEDFQNEHIFSKSFSEQLIDVIENPVVPVGGIDNAVLSELKMETAVYCKWPS